MMARTKRGRRSYGAGEWGRNRVRAFSDPKTGLFQLEWRENGRRLTRSLGHREWVRAKRQADEFAAGFAGSEQNGKAEAEPEPLTLGGLFDIYGAEVTPTKGEHSQRRDRAATKMFLGLFGRNRNPASEAERAEWHAKASLRRLGAVGFGALVVHEAAGRGYSGGTELLHHVDDGRQAKQVECLRLLSELTPQLQAAVAADRQCERRQAPRFNVFKYPSAAR